MRRSRIKAVANVPIRRKTDASNVEKQDSANDSKSIQCNERSKNSEAETSSEITDLSCSLENEAISNGKEEKTDKIHIEKVTDSNNLPFETVNVSKDNGELRVNSCNNDLDIPVFEDSSSVNTTFDKNPLELTEVTTFSSETSTIIKDENLNKLGKNDVLECTISKRENISDTSTENILNNNQSGKLKSINPGIKIISVTNIIDNNNDISSAYRKPPLSPCKVLNRPRIRSTPRLSHRRNSTSASESEDDSRRSHAVKNKNDTIQTSVVQAPSEEITLNTKVENDTQLLLEKKQASVPKKKIRRSDIARKMAEAKRDFYNKFGSKIPDRQKLTMMDLIFYNPPSNPMPIRPKKKPEEKVEETIENTAIAEEEADEPEEEALPVPQVKIGENGEIILDEQSLVIETSDTRKTRELTSTAINYDDLDTGYGIYKRAKRTKEWTDAETKQFYRVLQMIGTDFTMMMSYFKDRTRRDLKLKFKKEEKINRSLIDKVLLNPCTFDLEELQKSLDKDREIIRKQEEEKRKLEEIKQAEMEKRKRKPNTKRVRYKTGSWFARQMFLDKSEMSSSYDTDETININQTIKNDENLPNTELNSPPRKKRCKFSNDNENNNSDEDPEPEISTTKQLNNIFGKPTRSGRIIKTKLNLTDNNLIEDNNEIDNEKVVENNLPSDVYILPDHVDNKTDESFNVITSIDSNNELNNGDILSINDAEITINNAELSINDAEITVNDAELSINDAEIINEAEISINDAELSINDAEISINDAEISINDAEISINDAELSINEQNPETNTEKISNNVEIEKNVCMVETIQMKSIISHCGDNGELSETQLKILENYLGVNDSVTLELPVVDNEEIVESSENITAS